MSPKKKNAASNSRPEIQRPPAEVLYADELERLSMAEKDAPRPAGWALSPRSVLTFVHGDDSLGISPKFVGSRSLIERCIVALATNRGLMLIGEPGTAKSWLSELLAAAISRDSSLLIQGSAGVTEDNIKYSWNYALLLAEGPSFISLVPSPLYRGMKEGRIVRFEEITRCPPEIQDTLLSILSDRVMSLPELPDEERTLFAANGFNVLATANIRDRGVNEMSAALKRRFNFETVPPIAALKDEIELVERESKRMLAQAGIPLSLGPEMLEILVTTFHELRNARTVEGKGLEQLSSSMSTAEAVSTAYAAGIHANYFEDGQAQPKHIVQHLIGTVMKDSKDDIAKLRHYFSHVVNGRQGIWKKYYEERELLEEV